MINLALFKKNEPQISEAQKRKACAFTGHRPQTLPFGYNESDERCLLLKKEMKRQIIRLIEEENITHFISGMALGIDMFAAEIILRLKADYPFITLECAIPCETQAVRWNSFLSERYFNIVSKCDKETMLQKHYTADCMQKRNRYMVDQANIILAVWDGRPGGTGMTVTYARSQQKPVWILDPATCAFRIDTF